MNFAYCRVCGAVMLACLLYFGAGALLAHAQPDTAAGATIPSANRLTNAGFECDDGGYYPAENSRGQEILLPSSWTLHANGDVPVLSSARIFFEKWNDPQNGGCTTRKAHVEKIAGDDSLFVSSLDIEQLPEPGKPFDVSIYQQVDAFPGAAYSLSGWQLTLCGGSAVPNDCPSGYYMAKLLGIDPTGGTDPNAATVVWAENRNNFVTPPPENKRVGWSNVRTSAVATGDKVTVFARINSPFRWHGNHAFIDALSLVRAPISALDVTTASVTAGAPLTVTLAWSGDLGDDIRSIANQNFQLLYDVQYWHPRNNAWTKLREDAVGAGSLDFVARCTGETYRFRVRVRAEQPDGNNGSRPNQRYPGVWSTPIAVPIPASDAPQGVLTGSERLYLPSILAQGPC